MEVRSDSTAGWVSFYVLGQRSSVSGVVGGTIKAGLASWLDRCRDPPDGIELLLEVVVQRNEARLTEVP